MLDIPLDRVNHMCKLVPMKGAISLTLSDAMRVPDFRQEYDNDPTARHWIDIAMKLEGMNRNVGTHAAGVVISDGPITNFVPVQRIVRKGDNKEKTGEASVTTQWEMKIIEKVGMLKMDFLGLRNLSVLDETVKLIEKNHGIVIDPVKLPLDDKKTYELLQRGDAKGVFQLESDGIRELLKQMKPDNIRDLIAVLALYRPGPLSGGMVDSYVNRKHGRETWDYPHPVLKDVLDETYGVMCYQEQIMRILNRLGGIELSKAYACIKAISKKLHDKIEAFRADFMKGTAERGVAANVADDIFGKIVHFAGYGFNKCVVGDTEIQDAETGEIRTVRDIYETGRLPKVHALGNDMKLRQRAVTAVMANGVHPVFRLTTQLGHSIVATGNHPFRTLNQWTNLEDLQVGDRIAVPRSLTINYTISWPEHELITLAGLISEGNTCHPTTLYFYGNKLELVTDFANAVGHFPDTIAKISQRTDGRYEARANTGIDRRYTPGSNTSIVIAAPSRSGAYIWAKKLNLLGWKATQKRIPQFIYQLNRTDLALFLGRLWAGDGFIANAKLRVPFYATSSGGLAKDVQRLLLRFGITSRIHVKQFRYRGSYKPGYTVHLLGTQSIEQFLEWLAPHCLSREDAVATLQQHVANTNRDASSKDTIPLSIRDVVNKERTQCNLNWKQLETATGLTMQEFYGTSAPTKTGFRRSTISKIAAVLNSEYLHGIANSDIFWDRIASIESVGIEETYDLTVEEDHNFVANGIIVHNSHTAAYAQIGYQTAWLKTHYTAEFMAALLSSEIDDGNKRDVMVDHIADARKLGVEVLPPDVNQGGPDFDVVNGKIVFGLTAIKGLGRNSAEEIVRAREAGGKFKNIFDFCERVDGRILKQAAIEKLIKAGAMDCFARQKRKAMTMVLERAISGAEATAADRRRGQKNIFDMFDEEDESTLSNGNALMKSFGEGLPDCEEWPELDRLKFEKEALDYYISSHPLAQYDEQLRRYRSHEIGSLLKLNNSGPVCIAGMICEISLRTTKRGKRFAIVRVEDFTGVMKCVLWSESYDRFRDDLIDDAIILVEGRLERREGSGEPDLIVDRILNLDQARQEMTKSMVLKMPYSTDEEQLCKLERMGSVLQRSPGPCPVFLYVGDAAGRVARLKLGSQYGIDPNMVHVQDLEMLMGPGSVIFSSR